MAEISIITTCSLRDIKDNENVSKEPDNVLVFHIPKTNFSFIGTHQFYKNRNSE